MLSHLNLTRTPDACIINDILEFFRNCQLFKVVWQANSKRHQTWVIWLKGGKMLFSRFSCKHIRLSISRCNNSSKVEGNVSCSLVVWAESKNPCTVCQSGSQSQALTDLRKEGNLLKDIGHHGFFGGPWNRPGSIHRLVWGHQHWSCLALEAAPAICTPPHW